MSRATKKISYEADQYFPVIAVMNGVNFVWYNLKVGETVARIKIKVGRSHEDETLIKKVW